MPPKRRTWILGVGCLVASGCASTDAVRMVGVPTGREHKNESAVEIATAPGAEVADDALYHSSKQSESPANLVAAQTDTFRLASTALQADGASPAEQLPPPQPVTENSASEDSASEDIASENTATQQGGDAENEAIDTPLGEALGDALDGEVDRLLPPPKLAGAGDQDDGLPLQQVVASVQNFFPLLEVAFLERDRTAGDQLAAWGEFDTKLKARSESQPLGYYENYQNSAGVNQPLYRGGEIYSGYRIGRGSFEPWYKERETNEGGEFKAGFELPLLRDKAIDARRADLWRATYERQLAEPRIRSEVIFTIRDATFAYWEWVAAGQLVQIGEAALELADRRNAQVTRRVEEGDLGDPDLADNQRAIFEREGKLIDLQRKRVQTAVKLSLFLRDAAAMPRVPDESELPSFPEVQPYELSQLDADVRYATRMRPELVELDTELRKVQVDFAEANNNTLPILDAFSNVSQDTGAPTSEKRDKSELELEVGLEFELPVQRRKGIGKMRSARAKMSQIATKRQFTIEKISTEVAGTAAALDAAYRRVEKIGQAVKVSEELAQVERRKFELGESDLLAVFQREQIAIESASALVLAKLDYFIARADYTAALAYEFPISFAPQPPIAP